MLAAAASAAFAYASTYFAGMLFPFVEPRPYLEMMSAAVVGSLAAAVITAWPLIRLYGRRAWIAALVVAAPLMVLRLSDIAQYAGKSDTRIMVMSWFELVVYPAILLLSIWVVLHFSGRSKRTH